MPRHCQFNLIHHIIEHSRHVDMGIPQHADPLRDKPVGAAGIVALHIRIVVLSAIQFDGKPDRGGVEVQNKITDDVLA